MPFHSKTYLLTAIFYLALSASVVSAVVEWGQCGGTGYTGPTTCDTGLICGYINDWFSQCQKPTTSVSAASTTLSASLGSTITSSTSSPSTTASGGGPPPSLDAHVKERGLKYWGVVVDPDCLSNSQCSLIVKAVFGSVTPGNSMKWDATEPSQASFSFSQSDSFMNWAIANNKLIRGHVLVWHSQLPAWVSSISSAPVLTSVIQNHVTTLVTRYKGKIYNWDVCYEVLNEDGSMRSSVFYNVLGTNFINIAFAAARAADPAPKLYIVDYNMERVNAKTQGMVALVQSLVAQGVPIDGIGLEGHLSAGGAGGLQAALALLGTAASELAITELDISGAAAADYVTVLKACLSVRKCIGITSAGVSDAQGWPSTTNSHLFDNQYRPKPAYNALLKV